MQPKNFVRVDSGFSIHRPHVGLVAKIASRTRTADVLSGHPELSAPLGKRCCRTTGKNPHWLAKVHIGNLPTPSSPSPRWTLIYIKLMKILLKSGIYGLATHDEKIIREAGFCFAERVPAIHSSSRAFTGSVATCRISGSRTMNMRAVPFGTEWYPYLMRSLRNVGKCRS